MSGKTVRLFAVSALLMAGAPAASAQTQTAPTTESVTVMGSREAYHTFSRAFATPTPVTGKMARWERQLCPVVVGQKQSFAAFITQHIKYVALAAGAPVDTAPSCRPNIEIVFTTTPQELLNTVSRNDPAYLGYHTSFAQREALAKVNRPIQAWYATETTDVRGRSHLDSGDAIVNGNKIISLQSHFTEVGDLSNAPGQLLDLPPFYASTGTLLNDGIHTGFNHILIVVDSSKLSGQEIVPLADYISMLALTQIKSLDACQDLPSVVNRLAADCGRTADSLTQFDLAYLQGLYHMTAGRKATLQGSEIGALMTDRLENPR